MTTKALESRLVEKLAWAWNDGCPVGGSFPDQCKEMAAVARRRWFSFERRRPERVEDSRASRVEDLARGLWEKFTKGGLRMAGPEISDYRWLAEQLADVFLTDLDTQGADAS